MDVIETFLPVSGMRYIVEFRETFNMNILNESEFLLKINANVKQDIPFLIIFDIYKHNINMKLFILLSNIDKYMESQQKVQDHYFNRGNYRVYSRRFSF